MIFGIGLSKTGTNSLNDALTTLGYPSVHYPDPDLMLAGRFAEALGDAEGATDITVAAFFRELDDAYPGSKFILTVRDRRDWLASVESHMARREPESLEPGNPKGEVRRRLFGRADFDPISYLAAFELHRAEVLTHFTDREDDLLVVDLCGGDGWETLCPFLGLRAPRAPFPHANRTPEYRRVLAA